MSAEKNKAVLRRVIKEVINERNLAVVEELFSEEYITHPSLPGRTPGPEIARCNFSNMHATFPDIQATLESIVTEGEWVAIRGTMSGTHEETGKRVTWPLAVFLRFTEGSGRMRQVRLPGRCPTEKVSGIGGMFFRAEDPEALKEWYADNLGVVDSPGDVWRQEGGPTVFAPFSMETDHFGDRRQQFMVNFSVQDLDVLLSQLRAAGVEMVREEEEEGGRGGSRGSSISRATAWSFGSPTPAGSGNRADDRNHGRPGRPFHRDAYSSRNPSRTD